MVELKPKEKKAVRIKGMCTEQSDKSGNDNISYTYNLPAMKQSGS
ncbi:MAG: hypothetical protein U0T77_08370 [Chitinophagales bacterium]